MRKHSRIIMACVAVIGAVVAAIALLSQLSFAVLDPAGQIASQQRNLIIFSCLLMLLIVIPVFGLTFYISWKYRAGNTKARYEPDWDHNSRLETLWWGFPCAIILVLAVVTWNSSHSLDPYKPIQSDKKPMTIQVVALQWKWLFIYPAQRIASVNHVQFPAGTPIKFEITSDAPMNSFWIPRLGGQIYAMPGMTTQLHLMADKPGTYQGSSANLSGAGFAAMRFTATSSTSEDFDMWVRTAKISQYSNLSQNEYAKLAEPAVMPEPRQYATYERDLYDTVVMKYMAHHGVKPAAHGAATSGNNMESMHHE
ncbi:MAG TPA: ubiquinol oxidase subunit II [Candidatus Saccharimonadales bacterium]|jgi:cytochrome o ubiquinol oxidase subunit 2